MVPGRILWPTARSGATATGLGCRTAAVAAGRVEATRIVGLVRTVVRLGRRALGAGNHGPGGHVAQPLGTGRDPDGEQTGEVQ